MRERTAVDAETYALEEGGGGDADRGNERRREGIYGESTDTRDFRARSFRDRRDGRRCTGETRRGEGDRRLERDLPPSRSRSLELSINHARGYTVLSLAASAPMGF